MSAKPIRIGILGDFNPEYHSHLATNASLQHAAQTLGRQVESAWVPTPSLLDAGVDKTLASFDGLWISPGSPYKSMAGMLAGIQRARLGNWPLLAT
jgi:CTP synthase (UTP-ammonia lyase)